MNKTGNRLTITLTAVITGVLLLVAATAAWFTLGYERNFAVIIDSEGLDYVTHFYVGCDENHDGFLENKDPATYIPKGDNSQSDYIDAYALEASFLRDDYIAAYFNEQTAKMVFSDFSTGQRIDYKLVLENTNEYPISVSLAMSDITSYFDEAIALYTAGQNQNMSDLLQNNSGMILFTLGGASVAVYNDYTTMTSVSDTEIAGATKLLWELNPHENFVQDQRLDAGKVMEIDFVLYCINYTTVNERYPLFRETRINENIDAWLTGCSITDADHAKRTAIAAKSASASTLAASWSLSAADEASLATLITDITNIRHVYENELSKIVITEDNVNNTLRFTIDHFSLSMRQIIE